MNKLILLDLDRTAFKTDEHFADFCDVLKVQFGINASQLKEHEHKLTQKPSPYSPFDDIRYNDSISVNPDEVKRIATEILSKNGKNYVYEDVSDFLKKAEKQSAQIVIITVGTHEYQQHKLALCPQLQKYPTLITRESKANFLKKTITKKTDSFCLGYEDNEINFSSAVLIDDRAGTFTDDMPEFIECIRLKRMDAAYSDQPTPSNIREVRTLSEI